MAADIKAELIFDMDVSGSFEHEHEEGTTSQLVARLVPYGMVLDPDGQMDVFTFSNGRSHAHHVGTVTPRIAETYITRNVVGRVPGWNGGTTYSYVLERNLQHFGWLPQEPESGIGGFLSRFLGGQQDTPARAKKRSIVIFVRTTGMTMRAPCACSKSQNAAATRSTFSSRAPASTTWISASCAPLPNGSAIPAW